VEPALPAAWPGFRATRRFRGTAYEIDVRRAGSPAGGTAPASVALLVDGKAIEGTVVPLAPAGTPAVRVEVLVS
jgi:cellobiose phosphorylase